MSGRKQLVVNADDFGFTRDVNAGIVEAHRNGILTSTTLMANGDAFEDAVRLARENPTLDIGCHLVMVQGNSIVTGGPLPETLAKLLPALASGKLRPYQELSGQVRRILDAGIRPTHLDTHKHTHLAPPVLDAVVRIGEEFKIPWVRRPFDFPMSARSAAVPRSKRITSRAMGLMRGRFHRIISSHGCKTTDYFAGFQITGRFRTAELVKLLEALPEGSTEFMCHPGRCGAELRGAKTRLKESRERELEALLAAETRATIERNGIELTGFGKLR